MVVKATVGGPAVGVREGAGDSGGTLILDGGCGEAGNWCGESLDGRTG